MKKIMLFLSIILVTSCKSYIDLKRANVNIEDMKFNYFKDNNEFIYTSKINSNADTETYYVTRFNILLPKKIRNWWQSSNKFYFEYDSKQLIYIYTGYRNVGQEVDWYVTDFNQKEIYPTLSYYWDNQNYNENYLHNPHANRLTKLYTNGKVKILLNNIKKENFDYFLENIKSF